MQDLCNRLEPRRLDRELIRVGLRQQHDTDERLEPAPARRRIDHGGEAHDHPLLPQAPHPVGGGVRAQADRGAEIAPGQTTVLTEQTEDLAV